VHGAGGADAVGGVAARAAVAEECPPASVISFCLSHVAVAPQAAKGACVLQLSFQIYGVVSGTAPGPASRSGPHRLEPCDMQGAAWTMRDLPPQLRAIHCSTGTPSTQSPAA
jgi:hypothetical protein